MAPEPGIAGGRAWQAYTNNPDATETRGLPVDGQPPLQSADDRRSGKEQSMTDRPTIEIPPPNKELGWGSCMMPEGEPYPMLYWGARAIFHPYREEYEKAGLNRNRRTGAVVRSNPYKYRTIKFKAWLDLLPDRQGWAGSLYDDVGDFDVLKRNLGLLAFNGWRIGAMKQLVQWCQTCGPDDVFDHYHGSSDCPVQYRLRASQRQSGGYLYIASWAKTA